MVATIDESLIYKAINEIRLKQRQRPDKESVSHHILTKRGLTMAATLNTIDKMLEAGRIYNKKTPKGEDSFFISEGATAKDDIESEYRNQLQSTQVGGVGSVIEDPMHSTLSGMSQQSMAPRTTGSESHPSDSFMSHGKYAPRVANSESEDELSLGLGKKQEDCDNPAASPSERPRRDDRTDFMVYLDTVGRQTDQIDKLSESLRHERDKIDILREDNFQLRLENFTLKQQLRPTSSASPLGTGMEKSTNDIIEIRTELINKAENHMKAPVNETIASDNNPLSRDTSKETKEQNENKGSGTAAVNKPMAGKAKQNRRRKARKGKS